MQNDRLFVEFVERGEVELAENELAALRKLFLESYTFAVSQPEDLHQDDSRNRIFYVITWNHRPQETKKMKKQNNNKTIRQCPQLKRNQQFFLLAAAWVDPGRSALQSAEQRCQRRYGRIHQVV